MIPAASSESAFVFFEHISNERTHDRRTRDAQFASSSRRSHGAVRSPGIYLHWTGTYFSSSQFFGSFRQAELFVAIFIPFSAECSWLLDLFFIKSPSLIYIALLIVSFVFVTLSYCTGIYRQTYWNHAPNCQNLRMLYALYARLALTLWNFGAYVKYSLIYTHNEKNFLSAI